MCAGISGRSGDGVVLGVGGGRRWGWRLARVTRSGRRRESGCWESERVTHPGWHAEAREGGVWLLGWSPSKERQLWLNMGGLGWEQQGFQVSTVMGGSGFRSGILTGLSEAN